MTRSKLVRSAIFTTWTFVTYAMWTVILMWVSLAGIVLLGYASDGHPPFGIALLTSVSLALLIAGNLKLATRTGLSIILLATGFLCAAVVLTYIA